MSPPLLVCAFLIALVPSVSRAFEAADVRFQRVQVPPEIEGLSSPELIDLLPGVEGHSEELKGRSKSLYSADQDFGFLPLVVSQAFMHREDGKRIVTSPVLVELVRRGTESMPFLLDHLSDPRETRVRHTVVFDVGGAVGFADQYDPRDREREMDRTSVNRITQETLQPIKQDPYVLCVGDLCYFALGQIVGRNLRPVGGSPGSKDGRHHLRTLTINSPIVFPNLAAAARADWAGLSPEAHAAGLAADSGRNETRKLGYSTHEPSLVRLLFYYPAAGARETERRLRAEVTSDNLNRVSNLMDILRDFECAGWSDTYRDLGERTAKLTFADATRRLQRDELVLKGVERMRDVSLGASLPGFLADEVRWWEGWRKEDGKPPWLVSASEKWADRAKGFLGQSRK